MGAFFNPMLPEQKPETREDIKKLKGQSLFEVIVAVGVISLVLVGVLSLATIMVKNSASARDDALATKYAQEGVEYLRQQRDTNWANFYAEANGAAKNLGSLSWPPGGTCNIPTATFFCRTVTLTAVSNELVDGLVIVSWTDSSGTHQARSTTSFTKWR